MIYLPPIWTSIRSRSLNTFSNEYESPFYDYETFLIGTVVKLLAYLLNSISVVLRSWTHVYKNIIPVNHLLLKAVQHAFSSKRKPGPLYGPRPSWLQTWARISSRKIIEMQGKYIMFKKHSNIMHLYLRTLSQLHLPHICFMAYCRQWFLAKMGIALRGLMEMLFGW